MRETEHPTVAPATPALDSTDATIAQPKHQVENLSGTWNGAAPGRPPLAIPGYEILDELGRGGMGVVYMARQVALNRTVALKMVRGTADSRAVIRFLAEAEAVAAIDHPNVVRVFDYGEVEGNPFMALEYVPGGTLKKALAAAGPLAPLDAAALVEEIARGVQAAHDLGIVHRDLKPGNILLAGKSEIPNSKSETEGPARVSDFRPKVADFGLAKRAVGAELTGTGDLLGTPGYMSPEQAGGQTKFVGPTTDVWALGVVLYECLTGARPFEGDSAAEVLIEILRAETPAVHGRRPGTPRDLELICQKCLAKLPAQRYATAGELAEDLRRFRAGEPIAARPASLGTVIRAWAGQNFGSAGWAVPGGAAIGAAVGGFTVLELVGTKLYKASEVYDRLPAEARPALAFRAMNRGFVEVAEAVMYFLLPVLVLITAALVRPRNRSADLAAGLVTGLVASFAFFVVGLGWTTVYAKAVHPAADDLRVLGGSDAELVERFPDLAGATAEERRQVLADKVYYDMAVRVPVGVVFGMLLAFALGVPTCTALLCVAGRVLRQHRRLRTAVPLYLEITLPAFVFAGYAFLVAQRWALLQMAPQQPECYAGLLLLTGLAVGAALARWPAAVRFVVQFAWIAFYAVTNYHVCYEF